MRIYLAARYSRRLELSEYRTQLEQLNHYVTSRWLNGTHQSYQGDDSDLQVKAYFAGQDWEDLIEAATVISFTEEPRISATRGGRHVEFGAALAMDKRCIVVGHRENVFHSLPQVEFYETWTEALKWL